VGKAVCCQAFLFIIFPEFFHYICFGPFWEINKFESILFSLAYENMDMKEKHKILIILTLAAILLPLLPLLPLALIAEIAIFYYVYKLLRNPFYFLLYVTSFFIYFFVLFRLYYGRF